MTKTPKFSTIHIITNLSETEKEKHKSELNKQIRQELIKILPNTKKTDIDLYFSITENKESEDSLIRYSIEFTQECLENIEKQGLMHSLENEIKNKEESLKKDIIFKGYSYPNTKRGLLQAKQDKTEKEEQLSQENLSDKTRKDIQTEIAKLTIIIENKFPRKQRLEKEIKELKTILHQVKKDVYDTKKILRDKEVAIATITNLKISVQAQFSNREDIISPLDRIQKELESFEAMLNKVSPITRKQKQDAIDFKKNVIQALQKIINTSSLKTQTNKVKRELNPEWEKQKRIERRKQRTQIFSTIKRPLTITTCLVSAGVVTILSLKESSHEKQQTIPNSQTSKKSKQLLNRKTPSIIEFSADPEIAQLQQKVLKKVLNNKYSEGNIEGYENHITEAIRTLDIPFEKKQQFGKFHITPIVNSLFLKYNIQHQPRLSTIRLAPKEGK